MTIGEKKNRSLLFSCLPEFLLGGSFTTPFSIIHEEGKLKKKKKKKNRLFFISLKETPHGG
jgi:hypothetical protein